MFKKPLQKLVQRPEFNWIIATGVWIQDRFPFTIQGIVVLSLSIVALQIFGYGSMDLVVFSLSVCAIAIICFCLIVVLFAGLTMRKRLRHSSNGIPSANRLLRVETGYRNETGFSLPAMKYFPLVKLDWALVYPDYIHTRISLDIDENNSCEEIIPLRRCKTDKLVRLFTVRDVLGFCRFSWRHTQTGELLALPQTSSIKTLPLLRSLTAEDGIPNPSGDPTGDRMEIRPYVPGDSVRNIMWKVYARNRQLNVRLPEKSVFHSNRTIAYLLSSDNDEAAAAVARIAVESGALGDDWAFGADGSDEPCSNIEDSLHTIARSRAIDTPHPYGLDNFLQRQASLGTSHCIIFAAAQGGPWVQQVRASVNRFNGHFSVVLATDGVVDEKPDSFWKQLIYQSNNYNGPRNISSYEDYVEANKKKSAVSTKELSRLLMEMSQLVQSTMVVDRHTGYSFDHNMNKV